MPLALLAGAPVVSATNSVIGAAFVKVHQPVAVGRSDCQGGEEHQCKVERTSLRAQEPATFAHRFRVGPTARGTADRKKGSCMS
jgi:hypothetical protein